MTDTTRTFDDAKPGDVWAVRLDGERVAPLLVIARAKSKLTSDEEPVACFLDWLGPTLPSLEEITSLPPMPYRANETEGKFNLERRLGRPISGRAYVGDADVRFVGSIPVPPALASTARANAPLFIEISSRLVVESWESREGFVPPTLSGPDALDPGDAGEIVDDDGVIVVASRAGLRERFATRPYDYSFPDELVAGARARVLFGFQTEIEGSIGITLAVGPSDFERFVRGTCLEVRSDDVVLVAPYGTFTRGCDEGGDLTIEEDDAYLAFRVPAGRYRVAVRRVEPDDESLSASFASLLTPLSAAESTTDDETCQDVVSV